MYTPENDEETRVLEGYDPLKYPVIIVTVDVIVTREGKFGDEILLVKRGNYPYRGRWALPGGFIDEGEYASRAAMREVLEETGVEVSFLKFFTVADTPNRDPRHRAISLVYKGTSIAEPVAGDDAADARWFTLGATKDMSLAFDHNELIARLP